MPIRIVQLGSPRATDEGLRLGTVRRPPRGVPKAQFATRDFYDVWLPILAPSQELLSFIQHWRDDTSWKTFARKYRAEMTAADAARTIDLLAAMSHQANFAVGCYCADETRCHRSILRELLADRGASLCL